ncbi:MAG: hypothetical protein PF517_07590 [Salinivirgaceae bacterium]|jgi:hypothetical protein|nr:hypothetical protein [Salinivirgaceae bacterium]
MKTYLNVLKSNRDLIWVTLFAIAMAMLESAVVIYLRELYYPEGFAFPLKETSYTVAITELFREFATLIMLIAIGILVGKTKIERFAWFIYSFAIWDIFYYIFLYLIIDWPLTLSDWDVLFLLPIMWVGPVWAPVLLSLLMIIFALCILYFSKTNITTTISWKEWALLMSGSVIVIISFCIDFYQYMTTQFPANSIGELFFSKHTFDYAANYIPHHFNVGLFALGSTVILLGIGRFIKLNVKPRSKLTRN